MRSSVRWSLGLLLLVFALSAVGLSGPARRQVRAAEPAKRGGGVDLVPAEGFAVLSINAARLHDAEAAKPIRDALAKGDRALLKRVEADYGVPLDQLDRVTFYWPAADYGDPSSTAVAFVTTRKPLDKGKLIKTWKGTAEPKHGAVFGFGGQFGNLGQQFGLAGGGAFGNGGLQPVPACPPQPTPADDKPKEPDLTAPFYYCGTYGQTILVPIDDTTVALLPAGSYANGPAFVAALLRRKADGPLAEALALADKHDVVAAVHGKALREQIKKFREGQLGIEPGVIIDPDCRPGFPVQPPPPPGGQPPVKVEDEFTPFEPLAEMDRAVLTFDFGAASKLTVTAHYPTAEAAKKAEPVAKKALADLTEALTDGRKGVAADAAEKDWLPVYDFALAGLKAAKLTVDGKTLSAAVTADVGAELKAAFVALPTKIQEAADRMKLQNNLRQIGLALHNYHDSMGHLPRDVVDGEGKVLMSWRVELLPYLEANDLYTRIDRTKAWDDPANKKLWEEMPDVFKVPSRPTKEAGQTYLQAFNTVNWLGKDDPWLVSNHGTQLTEAADGTSLTAAVFEMPEPTNWMKPGDHVFDPKKLPAIGNPATNKAAVLMLDGAVRTLDAKKYAGDKLAAIITVNGGEEVNADDFK